MSMKSTLAISSSISFLTSVDTAGDYSRLRAGLLDARSVGRPAAGFTTGVNAIARRKLGRGVAEPVSIV